MKHSAVSILFLSLLCGLFLTTSSTLRAQVTRPFTVGWVMGVERTGPRVPIDSFYVTANESGRLTQSTKVAGSAGLRLQALLGGNATLRLDIRYADRGMRETRRFSRSGQPTETTETRIRYGYLSLPLTIRVPLNNGPAFLYLAGGGVADRLLFASTPNLALDQEPLEDWGLSLYLALGGDFPGYGESRGCFEIGWTRAIANYRSDYAYQPQAFGLMVAWML